jgi:hypothetical protein
MAAAHTIFRYRFPITVALSAVVIITTKIWTCRRRQGLGAISTFYYLPQVKSLVFQTASNFRWQ